MAARGAIDARRMKIVVRPSKCPKFYTNRILGKPKSQQKVSKFFQNFNCKKITYLIKYT